MIDIDEKNNNAVRNAETRVPRVGVYLSGGSMKRLVVALFFLAVSTVAFAVEPPVPEEFVGIWIPAGSSCQAKIGLRVEGTTVTLFNGSDYQQYGNLDICYSCEGGARYSGAVVWLLPEFGTERRAPFKVHFNDKEEEGTTVVEIARNDLKQRFPLHNVKLHKCIGKI